MSNFNEEYSHSENLQGMGGNSAPSDHVENEGDEDHGQAPGWREINRVVFVATAAGAIWFLRGPLNPYTTAIGVACTLVGGFPTQDAAKIAGREDGKRMKNSRLSDRPDVGRILVGQNVGKAARY